MKSPQKLLKSQAKRFLNLAELFPRGKPDLRTKLTEYQAKKIRHALREIEKIADGRGLMERDFVPLKGAKKYATEHDLPPYIRGVFMSGGDRDNKNAEYKNGRITYIRGGATREYLPLNNWSEKVLIKELREGLRALPKKGARYLTANGRVIRNSESNEDDAIEANARFVFNKYKDMAANGETRTNGSLAAHPKKWGIGLLWEAPAKKRKAK